MHTMTMRSLMLLASLGAALAQTPNPPAPGGQAGPMGPGRGPDPDIHALRAYLNLTDSQLQQMKQAVNRPRKPKPLNRRFARNGPRSRRNSPRVETRRPSES
jgi:Spy/CpxP family protein refolding chaperone